MDEQYEARLARLERRVTRLWQATVALAVGIGALIFLAIGIVGLK